MLFLDFIVTSCKGFVSDPTRAWPHRYGRKSFVLALVAEKRRKISTKRMRGFAAHRRGEEVGGKAETGELATDANNVQHGSSP